MILVSVIKCFVDVVVAIVVVVLCPPSTSSGGHLITEFPEIFLALLNLYHLQALH